MRLFKAEIWNLELLAEAFERYRVLFGGKPDLKRSQVFLKNRIRFDESIIFIAVQEESQLLGFVQLYPLLSSIDVQRTWLVNDLYVDDAFREQGVGRALMEKAREFAEYTNAGALVLDTEFANHPARQLYQSLGYQPLDNRLLYALTL
ncbi:MAG: GNAT family N-acetyltransferase [Plesiomonas shigelloides]